MTEQQIEPTSETPDEVATEVPDDQASDQDEQRPDSANREAAKYRRQAREAQAERDQLREVVTAYRRREAEEAAEAAGLERGGDLFDTGVDLAELLTDEGTVDAGKVKDAAAAVLSARPHWGRKEGGFDLGPRRHIEPPPNWQQVLKSR